MAYEKVPTHTNTNFFSMGNIYYSQEEYEKGIWKDGARKGPSGGEPIKLAWIQELYKEDMDAMRQSGMNEYEIQQFLKEKIIEMEHENHIDVYDEKTGFWLSRGPNDKDGGEKLKERLDQRFPNYPEWRAAEAKKYGMTEDEFDDYLKHKQQGQAIEEAALEEELQHVNQEIAQVEDQMLEEEVGEFHTMDTTEEQQNNTIDDDWAKFEEEYDREQQEQAKLKAVEEKYNQEQEQQKAKQKQAADLKKAQESEKKQKAADPNTHAGLPSESIPFEIIPNESVQQHQQPPKAAAAEAHTATEQHKPSSKTGKPGGATSHAISSSHPTGGMGGRPYGGAAKSMGGGTHISPASMIYNWIIATDNGKRPFFSTKPLVDPNSQKQQTNTTSTNPQNPPQKLPKPSTSSTTKPLSSQIHVEGGGDPTTTQAAIDAYLSSVNVNGSSISQDPNNPQQPFDMPSRPSNSKIPVSQSGHSSGTPYDDFAKSQQQRRWTMYNDDYSGFSVPEEQGVWAEENELHSFHSMSGMDGNKSTTNSTNIPEEEIKDKTIPTTTMVSYNNKTIAPTKAPFITQESMILPQKQQSSSPPTTQPSTTSTFSTPPTTTTPTSSSSIMIPSSQNFSIKPINSGIQKKHRHGIGLKNVGLNYQKYMMEAMKTIPVRYSTKVIIRK